MNSTLTIEDSITAKLKKAYESDKSSPQVLAALRKQSFERFTELGLPAQKSEAYKYTPIAKILKKKFQLGMESELGSFSKDEITKSFYPIEEANHLVFVNGRFDSSNSIIRSEQNELLITPINNETVEDSQVVSKLLNQSKGLEKDAFAQLNMSSFESGLALIASKNADIIPTFIYHFVDASSVNSITYPRIAIICESSSRMSIYERTVIKGSNDALNVSIVEAQVAQNAELRYTKVQNYSPNYHSIEGFYADQKGDSRCYTNTYSFNGAVIRNNIFITVDGENSEAHMNGLYQLSGSSHVDNNTSVDHVQPNCYSNEVYKGILDENARGVFNGKIYVRQIAQKTNAFQSNNNILLSEDAAINTKPQLEIWADDVKCSHGCTTGQLDEEAIFYLRARGISKTRAKALMLNAFANETLEEVKEELVRDEIQETITNKLG
ncbi:MAG: Fe-S cluster assembly protein SufD [Cyclobacteriaceae bacterium]